MTSFILSDKKEELFFYKLNTAMGQPMVVGTSRKYAKKFKTKESAQKTIDKYIGSGVGMVYTKILIS